MRCPLFGQGDETDLYSPTNGIPNSQRELIPVLSDTLGGFYPIAVALDSGAYPTDFTSESAFRWFWRARTWAAHMVFTVPSESISLDASFSMPGYASATSAVFADEEQLHDPLNGYNAHYRRFEGVVNFGTGPDGNNRFTLAYSIGSFNGISPVPTLNELFRQRTDGTYAPLIYIAGEITIDGEDDDIVIPFNTIDGGTEDWSLTIDGVLVSTTLHYGHPYAAAGAILTVDLVPSLFWSYGGLWNTTTGAALSNPRI